MSNALRTSLPRWQYRHLILLAGFLLMSWMMISRSVLHPVPFPLAYADEQGHYSYTQALISQDRWWPDFMDFPIYDAATNQPTNDPNFINHPPFFYWMMKLIQTHFPVANPLTYRIAPLMVYLLAIGVYARIGGALQLSTTATSVYALFPFLVRLELQGGLYSNDAFAVLGGTLCCLGSLHWLRHNATAGLRWMLLGLLLAAVKLNVLILVGIYLSVILLYGYRQWRSMSRLWHLTPFVVAILLLLPYLYFTYAYGSPAPNTIGQRWLLAHAHPTLCLLHMPTTSFLDFATHSLIQLVDQTPSFEMTGYAAILLLLCWIALPLSHTPTTYTRLATAAAIATLITLLIHLLFAYNRYRTYGWSIDMMARYYFPLIAAYGMTVATTIERLLERASRNTKEPT